MIITRTPFRISFMGGGSDLPTFYKQDYGRVLSTSINKYIYVAVKKQIGIVEHKFRITWSKVEFCNSIDEIEHPIVRVALKKHGIDHPLLISTFADIPANTGLGSSSAFTVGLLNALYALKKEFVSSERLAQEAAEIEVEVLKRSMGKQDHYACAVGGLNTLTFKNNGAVDIEPVSISRKTQEEFQNSIMLFYTEMKRDASEVLKQQDESTQKNFKALSQIRDMVIPLKRILMEGKDISRAGVLIDESWKIKRSLTSDISSKIIDGLYDDALKAGAIGGKILGAGGGGFLLFYVPLENQAKVRDALKGYYSMNIQFESGGTSVRYVDPDV